MSFYNHTWVKATRKAVRCTWCNEFISVGSAAWSHCGIWDGAFCSGKMHPECAAAADEVCDRDKYWESNGDYTRGRTDDDNLPPMFLPTYRGKDREQHKAPSLPSFPSVQNPDSEQKDAKAAKEEGKTK